MDQPPAYILEYLSWVTYASEWLVGALRSPGAAATLSRHELQALNQQISIADGYVVQQAAYGNGALGAAQLVSDNAYSTSLLRLVAASVRWPASGDSDLQEYQQQLATGVVLAVNNLVLAACQTGKPPPSVVLFARKMLWMDALQCCSRKLSAAVDALGIESAPFPPSGTNSSSRSAVQQLAGALWLAVHLLSPLTTLASMAARPQRVAEAENVRHEQRRRLHPQRQEEGEQKEEQEEQGQKEHMRPVRGSSGDSGDEDGDRSDEDDDAQSTLSEGHAPRADHRGGSCSGSGGRGSASASSHGSPSYGGGGGGSGSEGRGIDAFAEELALSLHASALLEHAARAVLTLAEAAPASAPPCVGAEAGATGDGGGAGSEDGGDGGAGSVAAEGGGGDQAAASVQEVQQVQDAFNFLFSSLCGLKQLLERWDAAAAAAAGGDGDGDAAGGARAASGAGSADPASVGRSAGLADFGARGAEAASAASTSAAAAADGRSRLRAALSGPCVRHLLLAAAVRALSAADGGSGHGLPSTMLARLPVNVLSTASTDAPDGDPEPYGGQRLDDRAFRWLPTVLEGPPFAAPQEQGPVRATCGAGRCGGGSASQAGAELAVGAAPPVVAAPLALPVSLLLRLARLALASAWEHGEERGAPALGLRIHAGPRPQLLLPTAAAMPIAVSSIASARSFLQRWPRGRQWRGGATAAAAAESWQLATAAAQIATSRDAAATAADLADREAAALLDDIACLLSLDGELRQLAATEQGRSGVLPAAPPAGMEAALAGGLLPCLERLLRRAGQDPSGTAARLLLRLLRQRAGGGGDCGRYLGCLLAYGEPAQAAALVATMGKVLRRLELELLAAVADAAAAAAAAGGDDADNGDPIAPSRQQQTAAAAATVAAATLALAVVDAMYGVFTVCAGDWLLTGAAAGEAEVTGGPAAAGRGGGGPEPPARRLALLVSYAAREWLPQLSHLTCLLAPELTTRLSAHNAWRLASMSLPLAAGPAPPWEADAPPPSPPLTKAVTQLVLPLLSWLPMLAYLAAGDGGAAAAGVGAAAAGGSAEEGWQQLQEEIRAVPLLGSVLQLAATMAEVWGGDAYGWSGVPLWSLAESCCWVAAARPSDVAAAAGAWPLELLRGLLPYLQARGWYDTASCTEALAAQLAACSGGAAAASGTGGRDASYLQATARMLVPPAEVARRLPATCAYPGCSNLAGDSEAEVELAACCGCGVARYCSGECRAAHLRAGHGVLCMRLRRRR